MDSLRLVAIRISQLHRFSGFSELSSNRNGKFGGAGEDGDVDGGDWNDAWETAWLPVDAAEESRAPWEADVNFGLGGDAEALEFLAEMDENWSERKSRASSQKAAFGRRESPAEKERESESLGRLDGMKKDYRLKKQRIHAGLWMKEIEKLQESEFGSECDDIERLIDSCSDIFESGNGDEKVRSSESEFKAKPDGWETTSKTENDGNVWEMTQREEDILLQEFDRRIAYSKFQIASFIKTHIFSRRRPTDGWKYMIEELGPNARKGKGTVSRLPTLSDSSTQPFKEEKTPIAMELVRAKVGFKNTVTCDKTLMVLGVVLNFLLLVVDRQWQH